MVVVGLSVLMMGLAFGGGFTLVGASQARVLVWVVVPILMGCSIIAAGAHVLGRASRSGFSPIALSAYIVGSLLALVSVLALARSEDSDSLLSLMLVASLFLVAGAALNHLWRRARRAARKARSGS